MSVRLEGNQMTAYHMCEERWWSKRCQPKNKTKQRNMIKSFIGNYVCSSDTNVKCRIEDSFDLWQTDAFSDLKY